MSKTNEERLKDLFTRLDSLSYIKPASIPDIPLYMDQVTTFMDEHLGHTKRYPEDKVLTKTMINNYAKNNLLFRRQSDGEFKSRCGRKIPTGQQDVSGRRRSRP